MRPRVTAAGLFIPPDPALDFEYPQHIERASLDALPKKPGMYVFRDPAGTPLYIGKSVDLRARVLSHLRCAEEAALLKASARVDFTRTAGEVGALLLEAQMVKRWQPPFNSQLKTLRPGFALAFSGATLAAIEAGSAPGYGLYASRAAAEQGLRDLVARHRLCPALLGLEGRVHGRACFSHQIGRCLGACIGRETRAVHQARLQAALESLQQAVWPYPGPVGIVERDAGLTQVHVVDGWSYLGSLQGRRTRLRRPARRPVDIDTYRILVQPLLQGVLEARPCAVRDGQVVWEW